MVEIATSILTMKKGEEANTILNLEVAKTDYFHIDYKGHENNFPKNIIIPADKLNSTIVDYVPSMFKYERVDLDSVRIVEAPLDLTFMVNNRCLTDCVYCYANKEYKYEPISFHFVEKIVQDAYRIGIRNISVDGGEFFIYPYWRELLQKLKDYKFRPSLVSTKYPISEKDIKDFIVYNVPLQISIDSFNSKILKYIVGNIPYYANRIFETIQMIDKYYSFQIATILTKYNGTIENLEEMFGYIRTFKNIRKWDIRVGFKSLYSRQEFANYQIERTSISKIQRWVEEKRNKVSFDINFSPGREVNFFKSEGGSKSFVGARCSANSMHMFILPDGQVTICEQLYWNKHFLIGDLKKQSISEVWNSPRALFLANMSEKDYSETSVCKTCKLLESCNAYQNKCYANILKVYGNEHWDYPDPRCIYAPRNISESIYV